MLVVLHAAQWCCTPRRLHIVVFFDEVYACSTDLVQLSGTAFLIGMFLILNIKEAGLPGFEPGLTGPKPVALPLGYSPTIISCLKCFRGHYRIVSLHHRNIRAK